MAKLGTKGRPAIVRVRTQARAMEIASVCKEHGWTYIVGIESDKPENIADLTRLLKTTRSGRQIASNKAKKTVPRSKSNAPLRVVQTRKERTRSSKTDMKVTEESCEYFPDNDSLKRHAVVSFCLSVLFLILFVMSTSPWYVILLVLPLFYSLSLSRAIFLNQRIVLYDKNITIVRRNHAPLNATVADALYQIVVKRGVIIRFRFRFYNGRKVAQICPPVYKNGDQLLQHLTAIIDQEKIVVDIIEK
jgi:hypothetical protein